MQHPLSHPEGVAEILPSATKTALSKDGGYNSKGMLSAYLWSHFGDLFADPEATGAYDHGPDLLTRPKALPWISAVPWGGSLLK